MADADAVGSVTSLVVYVLSAELSVADAVADAADSVYCRSGPR